MDQIEVKNILAAVFGKKVLNPLLDVLVLPQVCFWATEGTAKYLIEKGFSAKSVVSGFDFDGRLKTISREIFARILADKSKETHMAELAKIQTTPFDAVIVSLYEPDRSSFPESMDIGGQTMIRAAIKNYQNVALAFDQASIKELAEQMSANQGSTLLAFRKKQAKKAADFIAKRCKLEAELL